MHYSNHKTRLALTEIVRAKLIMDYNCCADEHDFIYNMYECGVYMILLRCLPSNNLSYKFMLKFQFFHPVTAKRHRNY